MPIAPQRDPAPSASATGPGERRHGAGARILLIGGVLFAIGLLLWAVGANFAAAVFLALSTPPTLAGIALELSAGVSRRAASGKPFA